jgi:hypothetical protein
MSRDLESTGPRAYLVGYGKGGVKPWPELIEGASRRAVLREVGRAVAAGELAASGPLEHVGRGRYQVAVWRIRERAVERRWRKPVLVAGGAVMVLGGVAALGWWLVGAATSALAAVSLPVLGVGGALLWLVYAGISGGGGGCETTVTVRHRHW